MKEVDARTWREPPAPAKGYVIAPESIDAGINPITGIPYLFYRMVRIPDDAVAVKAGRDQVEGRKGEGLSASRKPGVHPKRVESAREADEPYSVGRRGR